MKKAGKRAAVLLFSTVFMLLSVFYSAAAMPENAVFPDGFSFEQDIFSFPNPYVRIPREYYTGMYGDIKGNMLYGMFETEEKKHSVCYGYAIANASVLSGSPAADSFRSADGIYYSKGSELLPGSVSEMTGLPLLSYMKYAYTYQASSSCAACYRDHADDAQGLYQAVYDYVYNGGSPVIVGLIGRKYSHEVLAVGLAGEDILISDSNDPSEPQIMDFTGKTWKYKCAGLVWRSSDSSFDYSSDVFTVFDSIASGGIAFGSDLGYSYSQAAERTAETDFFVPGMTEADREKLLVLYPETFVFDQLASSADIGEGTAPLYDDQKLFTYAWLFSGNTVSGKNNSRSEMPVLVCGEACGAFAVIPPGGIVSFSVSGENAQVEVYGGSGKNVTVGAVRTEQNGSPVLCRASGQSEGGTVSVSVCGDSLSVTGMQNITAQLLDGSRRVIDTENVPAGTSFSWNAENIKAGMTVGPGYDVLKGDADGDGEVSSADARIVLRCCVKLEDITLYDFSACDFDGDGELTPSDARLILRCSVGLV